MGEQVRICMLGEFHITCDGRNVDDIVNKSRKGMALLQYLVLQHGESVPVFRLIEALWANDTSSNPESALKTLVSRLRVILGQVSPALSHCLHTERGSYRWSPEPGVTVDVYDFEALEAELSACETLDEASQAGFRQAMALYAGNLLHGSVQEEWIMGRSAVLHDAYLRLIYRYLALLGEKENYTEIINVCRTALEDRKSVV